MTYEVLNQLPEGTDDFTIVTTFKGFPKSNRRSGKTEPGKWEATVTTAVLESKVNKPGRNIHAELEVNGVIIHKYMPAPLEQTENDPGYRNWRGLVDAVLSYSGKLEQSLGQTREVSSKDLIGKKLYVLVANGAGDYADTSVIERFISREEYERDRRGNVDEPSSGNGSRNRDAVGNALFQR